MRMFGETIDARSSLSPAIPLFVLIAAGLIAWSVLSGNVHPLFGAVLPLGLAIGLALGQPRRAVVLIDNDGLRPFGTPEKIYFREISAVTVGGREYANNAASLPAKPIDIYHDRGILVVPPVMNVEIDEFHNFILSQVPTRPPREVPTILAEYLAEQVAKFGPEKVQVIHTRRVFTDQSQTKQRKGIGIGLFLVGLIWLIGSIAMFVLIPHAEEFVIWLIFGIAAVIAGLVGYFVPGSLSPSAIDRLLAKHSNSCIIVAPTGIAMIQGDTKGALPWHEITKITTNISKWVRSQRAHGMRLHVRGAEIIVFDIYDRSPAEIEQLMRRNLGPASM